MAFLANQPNVPSAVRPRAILCPQILLCSAPHREPLSASTALSSRPLSSRSSDLPRSDDAGPGDGSLCTFPGGACAGVRDKTSPALGNSSVLGGGTSSAVGISPVLSGGTSSGGGGTSPALAVEASSCLIGSVPGRSPDLPDSSGGVPSFLDRVPSSIPDALGISSIPSLAKEDSDLGEIPSPDGEVSPALVGGSSSAVPGGVLEGSVLGEMPAAAPLAMEGAAPSASPIAGAVVLSVLVVGVRSARSLWASSARLRSSSLTRRR